MYWDPMICITVATMCGIWTIQGVLEGLQEPKWATLDLTNDAISIPNKNGGARPHHQGATLPKHMTWIDRNHNKQHTPFEWCRAWSPADTAGQTA